MNSKLQFPREDIAQFCQVHGIQRLAVFGSALRSDFCPESDIDILVEFLPGKTPGLFGIARMEREPSALFGGRRIDPRAPQDLSRYFHQKVLDEAEVQCVHG